MARLRAGAGVSEARVAAALEAVAAAARPLERPTVVSLDAVPAASADQGGSLVSALASRLVLENVGVVAPAGNEGPRPGTVAAPASSLAAVVGAAARASGLQPYSGRGVSGEAPIAWTDLVDETGDAAGAQGTGEAAERSAAKLAALGRQIADAFGKAGLPDGWFLLARSAVEKTLAPMRAQGPHEVGGGLFGDSAPARRALELILRRRDVAAADAMARIAAARQRHAALLVPASSKGGPVHQVAAAALQQLFHGPTIDAASRWIESIESGASLAGSVFAGGPAKAQAANAWWTDPARTHLAETVPVYALRREKDDPGIGKWTDLGRYYRQTLAKAGVGVALLLPHFATAGQSPYAPVSLYAVNEQSVDWAVVPEVARTPALRERLKAGVLAQEQTVDYDAVRAREAAVAREAYAIFQREELSQATPRAEDFRRFVRTNARWLDDYAEFMALSALLTVAPSAWTPEKLEAARKDPRFAELTDLHRYAQWHAYGQLSEALREIHAAGGRALFDVPMFRSKAGLDVWRHPELFKDVATRNPGIRNQWVNEDWGDLALWNWTELAKEGYGPMLDPFSYWLDFGFDGARIDALHFAYRFGNGQLASGDEPGEPYVAALGRVFQARGALPVAEAFEGKDDDARRHGMLTVGGDWKKVSSHDDSRQAGFIPRVLKAMSEAISGATSRFVAFTLGDEWGDPFPVKEMRGHDSLWRYRIPLPSDPDYAKRAPADASAHLQALAALRGGDVWKAPDAVKELLDRAAASFVHQRDGRVEIWAASMDWFLEEWGRDTFVSLPGLLLSRGRYAQARESLRRFAGLERNGLIPNRIPPGGAIEYNTSDGSLWFIHALRQYAEATGDHAFVEELRPVVERILAGYERGSGYDRYRRFNRIFMDGDGLIVSPAQSTWMDADPEGLDRPVTPRNGKAVDINALWYGALRFAAETERRAGKGVAAADFDALADRVKKSFNDRFWFEHADNARAWGGTGGALRDVVDGDPHGEAIRPNMLFAVSHGGDLLSPERRRAVVLAATKDLLTPYGLRTLSPRDSYYRGRYETWKPPVEKDRAYHQGTAWPWLLGPYLDALSRVRRDEGWDEARIREEARAVATPLVQFLVSRPEASLPEVFDGGAASPAAHDFTLDDPAGVAALMQALPRDQNPGGTRSQAWSVAELLRKVNGGQP